MSGSPVVLVAEDDTDILELVALRIERAGLTVLRAHDGEEALHLARRHSISAAVLDVMMPKLDGIELTRQLRSEGRTAELPILLLTARSQDEDVARGLAAGADEYITKPFDPRDFRDRLLRLLSGQALDPAA